MPLLVRRGVRPGGRNVVSGKVGRRNQRPSRQSPDEGKLECQDSKGRLSRCSGISAEELRLKPRWLCLHRKARHVHAKLEDRCSRSSVLIVSTSRLFKRTL